MSFQSRLLTIVGLVAVLGGCKTNPITDSDMVADKSLTVAAQDNKQVALSTPTVIRHGNTVTVSGIVSRKTADNSEITGHIDVMIVDRNGETIVILPAVLNPHKIPTTGKRQSKYEVKLGVVPPEGSSVSVAFNDEKQPTGSAWGKGGGGGVGFGGSSHTSSGVHTGTHTSSHRR